MWQRIVLLGATLLLLSAISGAAFQAVANLAGRTESGLAAFLALLMSVSMGKVLALAPGLISGYLFGANLLSVTALIGFLSYVPFHYGASKVSILMHGNVPNITYAGFELDVYSAIIQGAASSIQVVVAVLAGAYLRQLCRQTAN